jgi:AraC-like DNA-binding protein
MVKIDKSIRKIHNIPIECNERFLVLDNEGGQALRQVGVSYAGVSKLVAGYQVCGGLPLQRHMVIFTNSGQGYVATSQHEYRVNAGEIIIVPVGGEVIFGVEGTHWDITWFYLHPIDCWRQLQTRGIWLEQTELIQRINMVMEWTMAELQALSHDAGDINLADKYSKLLIVLLTSSFGIIPSVGADSEINIRLNELLYNVQNSLNYKWSLAQMATEIKLTPITLQRLIKKRFNTTAHQLLIDFRMRQAEIMLKNSGYPLKVIADQLGYSDEFIFSTAFRHYHNISPGAYRKR